MEMLLDRSLNLWYTHIDGHKYFAETQDSLIKLIWDLNTLKKIS